MEKKWKNRIAAAAVILFAAVGLCGFTAQDIQKKYSSFNDFEASFEQKTFQVLLNKEVTFQGKVIFKKPGKVRMDVLKPQRQILILQGSKIVVIIPEQKVIAVQDVPKEIAAQNFLAFMGGISTLEKDYSMKMADGALVLTPKTGTGQIKVRADSDNIIRRISIIDSMGNKSEISLGGYRFNINPDEELFKIPELKESGPKGK